MSHYFDASPTAASRPRTVELVLPDLRVTLQTDRGVFSPDAVDRGTKLLLLEAASVEGSPVLDLGCGYGAVAVTLALRSPAAEVWAVDVNTRALELTAANASACGVGDRVRVALPDDVPEDVRFAGIWSNPPIRVGKSVLHSMLSLWLGRMAADGSAWLVVQKHLGSDSLHSWLTSAGFDVRRVVSRSGYRVLEVRRP
jgi:16S rRNA (guanine1207-N2)-methyltransferase